MYRHKNPYFSIILAWLIVNLVSVAISILGFALLNNLIVGGIGIIAIMASSMIVGYYLNEYNKFEEFIKMKQEIVDKMVNEMKNNTTSIEPFEDFDKRGE